MCIISVIVDSFSPFGWSFHRMIHVITLSYQQFCKRPWRHEWWSIANFSFGIFIFRTHGTSSASTDRNRKDGGIVRITCSFWCIYHVQEKYLISCLWFEEIEHEYVSNSFSDLVRRTFFVNFLRSKGLLEFKLELYAFSILKEDR